jgi:hypothetical protein
MMRFAKANLTCLALIFPASVFTFPDSVPVFAKKTTVSETAHRHPRVPPSPNLNVDVCGNYVIYKNGRFFRNAGNVAETTHNIEIGEPGIAHKRQHNTDGRFFR